MDVVCSWVSGEQEQMFTDFLPKEILQSYRENPQVLIYGIGVDRVAAGAAVVHVMETEAYLKYIYVAPDYRGQGLFSRCIFRLGYDLWSVGVQSLSAFYIPGEHEAFHRRMELHDAHLRPTGGGAFRFTLADAKKCPDLAGSMEGAESLASCSKAELLRLGNRLKKQGADIVPLPIEASDYEADCSCVFKKGGEISAVLLVRQESDAFDIPFLYSDAQNPAALLILMRYALSKGSGRFSDDTVCTLRSVDQAMTKLLEKLLGEKAEAEMEVKLSFDNYNEYYRQFMELFMVQPVTEM